MNIKSPFLPSLLLSIIELMKPGNGLLKGVLLFVMPWARVSSERIMLANSNSCMFLNRTLSGELPSETMKLGIVGAQCIGIVIGLSLRRLSVDA